MTKATTAKNKAGNENLRHQLAAVVKEHNALNAQLAQQQTFAANRELTLLRKIETLVTQREELQSTLASLTGGNQCIIPQSEVHAKAMREVAEGVLDSLFLKTRNQKKPNGQSATASKA